MARGTMLEIGLSPSTEKLWLLGQYYQKFPTFPGTRALSHYPTYLCILFFDKHVAIYIFDGTTLVVMLCGVHFTKLLTHIKIVHSHFFFTSIVKEGIICLHSSILNALNSCTVLYSSIPAVSSLFLFFITMHNRTKW